MRFIAISLLCFLVVGLSPAEARHYRHHASHHHHHHHHYAKVAKQKPTEFFNWFASGQQQIRQARERRLYAYAPSYRANENNASSATTRHSRIVYSQRPSDCYGIAWCGCWLKHYMGVAASRLNLNRAIEWARLGSSTHAHAGAVVVWRHHVGKLMSEPDGHGYAIVLSGNSGGRTGVTEVRRYIGNAVAFRDI